jgi:flagellum-specific ATP synthase
MIEHPFLEKLRSTDLVRKTGRVTKVSRTYIEADGPSVPLRTLCSIDVPGRRAGADPALAEVVALGQGGIVLAPFEEDLPTSLGALVTARPESQSVAVGDGFLGRAVDAMGRPLDGGAPIRAETFRELTLSSISPLQRVNPHEPLTTGIRAIDGLLTLGRGQRVGIFAASGAGKTSLLAQLARQVEADCCVICLVGERGREVGAFWNDGLSDQARSRSTLIAATSEKSAAMRVRAAEYAIALADHWRSKGRHVLLLMDSVTRLAMALREIGLAAGEPPTVRAYTPGVFAAAPRFVEACGALRSSGAITAMMTVLSETDDVDDPIVELMKSLLDGHIVLSRTLAEQGRFPAIDVPRSVSRLADRVRSTSHQASAQAAAALLSVYESSRTLIEAGLYAQGADSSIDRAIERRPALLAFLKQRQDEQVGFESSKSALADAVGRRG